MKRATVRHCFIWLHKDAHSITLLLSFSFIVFSPLLRLSPPPGDHDYIYNLDETEGLCDLFDVPIANLWPPNTPYNESSVLKRTFFFLKPFSKEEKKKAWLCVRSICMISWFCVYIKLFLYVYIYFNPKVTKNEHSLLNSTAPIWWRYQTSMQNYSISLVPSKAIVFILLLYRHRGKFIFITK